MSDLALRVDHLSKSYRIAHAQDGQKIGRYKTLQEDLLALPRSLWAAVRGRNGAGHETIWALRDISFEITQGEVIGIIGRNGAGKSTLLKILSRITEPTKGRVEVYGRIGSLLEVGTGFHPELTGRENIFLNGAVLGMRRAEIARKFDEIVAFAEIDKFIDTPVKHYSSGMYVRLAFAVAAHLEPEILLVDEVLAVGDYEFQKKCLGKMGDIGREGRTVLVVSHNMVIISNLCLRAILLDAGKVMVNGPAPDVVQHYIASTREIGGEVVWSDPTTAPGNEKVRLHAVRILSEDGKPTADVDIGKDVLIQIEYRNFKAGSKLFPCVLLRDQMGASVLSSSNYKSMNLTEDPWFDRVMPTGLFRAICRIPANILNDISYSVTAFISNTSFQPEVWVNNAVSFRAYDTGKMRKEYLGGWAGAVRPLLAWHTEKVE